MGCLGVSFESLNWFWLGLHLQHPQNHLATDDFRMERVKVLIGIRPRD